MDFNIALTVTEEVDSTPINDVESQLKAFLKDKHYGDDFQFLAISMNCVSPKFESFFRKGGDEKPKYTYEKVYKGQFHEIGELKGQPVMDYRVFSYPIWLDYKKYMAQDEQTNKKMVIDEIIKSFKNFDKLPKRVKDFDRSQFEEDVTTLLNALI